MSDLSVRAALRSLAKVVVVEAPAGCGKTHQGVDYACEVYGTVGEGRILILAHTHAAVDEFSSRTRPAGGRVEIRTLDSLIGQIAGVYHLSLGLPADTNAWARTQSDGYCKLAGKVASLLVASPIIARSLAQRYPIVICDEHQDASSDQHAVAMAFHKGGAALRIFGDPMQRIFRSRKRAVAADDDHRWEFLKRNAEVFDELDEPHRWPGEFSPLGKWILSARNSLRTGGRVDLRGNLPPGVSVFFAENQSPKRGGYHLPKTDSGPIYAHFNSTGSIIVLATHNDTVESLHAFFGRRVPIWEGHVRDSLTKLVGAIQKHRGDAPRIALATLEFIYDVATGFSPSNFGKALSEEVSNGCVSKRSGKPAKLQELGRLVLDQPNHKGVANLLSRLHELTRSDSAFTAVRFDYRREFWEAVQIGQFDDSDEGFAEISRRRSYSRPSPPTKTVSTIHKAKGLQCNNVLIMPCDGKHFGDSAASRCCLYVAMSRAMRSLTFVVSRRDPSPLLAL